jgi:predicted CXXCH cytochrome family protein
MDVLLRELREGPGGIAAYRDTELGTKEISVGSAPGQQIQLLGRAVGPTHAVIRAAGRDAVVVCVSGRRLFFAGKERRSARLRVGEKVEIGGHQIELAQAPTGFDLAVEVRPNFSVDGGDFEAAYVTDLQQTWLRNRWPTWFFMFAIAVFGFGIPLAVIKLQKAEQPMVALARDRLPSDRLWSTGPLGAGHEQLLGESCAACHTTLFQKVKDETCAGCHKNTASHVTPATLAKTTLGPNQRCADCHHEHDEPNGQLIDRSDRVCVACHGDAPSTFGVLKGAAVTGFGTGRHPPFAASANLAAAAQGKAGLKFSHAQHLDTGQVRKSGGDRLGCSDCHKPQPDGEHFKPITMAEHCASCHELTFDPDAPERQLPHGKPREVARALQDYFARKLSEPARAKAPARQKRRLPGQEDSVAEVCTGPTYACAQASAARELETQFLRRGCVGCHQVTDTGSKDLAARFVVTPIKLPTDYYPAATFPHRRHAIQGQVEGDAACLTCHPATKTNEGQLMLPDVPGCETCHADTPVRNRTRLQCVSCHSYHPHS